MFLLEFRIKMSTGRKILTICSQLKEIESKVKVGTAYQTAISCQ